MPFTFNGDWIPSKQPEKKPTQIRLVKRGNKVLTLISHLPCPAEELEQLTSTIKKKLACGGTRKENTIEIQGDKIDSVKKYLHSIGITIQ